MVKINIIMNSSIEEVLAFKCCSLPDLNLEIQVKNLSDRSIVLQNFFFLKTDQKRLKIENVYPPRHQQLSPNDLCALYCSMDEQTFQEYNSLELVDTEGNAYSESYHYK